MANEDKDLLRWVRGLPCCARRLGNCLGQVEAHHAGRKGMGQRAHDDTAIPLCRGHHGAWHSAAHPFKEWDKAKRQLWAEEQVATTRAMRLSGVEPCD